MIFTEQLHSKIKLYQSSPAQIGELSLSSPLIMAPLAGITTAPFRAIMSHLGAGACVSELISAKGILYGGQKTLSMLRLHPQEQKNGCKVGIQLFGDAPEDMAKAAKIAQDYGPDFIDINMGCPVRKVAERGAGAGLMRDVASIPKLFSEMKKAIAIPLTVKMRTGWDHESQNALEIMKIAHEEGLSWVAIHGRTRAQAYEGEADWTKIESLAREAKKWGRLGVIGNGDLNTPARCQQRLESTQCDGLMIGRGALKNPFIFLETFGLKNLGLEQKIFTAQDYGEVASVFYKIMTDFHPDHPERLHLINFRKHLSWLTGGFSNSSHFRKELFQTKGLEETLKLGKDFFRDLGEATKGQEQDDASHFAELNSGHG